MKKILLSTGIFLFFGSAKAQVIAGDDLNINNVNARFNADNYMFGNFSTFTPGFEVPKGSNKHTICAGNIWVGGIDAANTLKIAGQTYKQTGTDFWPGPLSSIGTTDSATISNYNRVWKLNRCDIDAYVAWLSSAVGPNPLDSVTMNTILTWPAFSSFGLPLAPFVDANVNGIYDPYAGDYPSIKGDQAIFYVFNDNGGIHGETGGTPVGLEIQCMAYAYSCSDDSALNNTIFTNYRIINKSSFRLDSAFIGNWVDLDVGSGSDDFIGCDVSRGFFYGFNADSLDGTAAFPYYGLNPPAQGVVFLAGPYAEPNGLDDPAASVASGFNYGDAIVDNERIGMGHSMYYNNDGSSTGNPSTAAEFYNYLAGSWKDGTPWTYGGSGHLTGIACNYIYPGNTDPMAFGTNGVSQPAWDEITSGNVPADRRGLGSYGPFTFQPGSVEEIDFAYVFGRAASGGHLASVSVLQERVDSIRQKFSTGITGCGCSPTAGIPSVDQPLEFSIFPNPATDELNIRLSNANGKAGIRIFDVAGKLVEDQNIILGRDHKLSISALQNGMYFITVNTEDQVVTGKFIKQ